MIHLQLQPEIEAQLNVEAQLYGLTPESYVEKLIVERKTGLNMKASDSPDRLTVLEKFFEDIAAHSNKIPLLSEEAFTRESFYRDHD